MFEDNTFEAILQRRLANVSRDQDKTEGSFVYESQVSGSIEDSLIYAALDRWLEEVFATTASREYLIKRAEEFGLAPHEAVYAVWRVKVTPEGLDIPIGTRFNSGVINLAITKNEGSGYYLMQCETVGVAGNSLTGSVIPIYYISGLTTAVLQELVTAGTEEEDTEDFRDRFLTYVQNPGTSGNATHYYNWAMSVSGVGGCKIYPLWNGNGTVKVVIVDDNMDAATQALVTSVYDYIETVRPIGPTVTVVSATEVTVNVAVTVELEDGYTEANVTENIETALTDYFESYGFKTTSIERSQIGKIILDTEGVANYDYDTLLLNSSSADVTISSDQIAKFGALTLTVEA